VVNPSLFSPTISKDSNQGTKSVGNQSVECRFYPGLWRSINLWQKSSDKTAAQSRHFTNNNNIASDATIARITPDKSVVIVQKNSILQQIFRRIDDNQRSKASICQNLSPGVIITRKLIRSGAFNTWFVLVSEIKLRETD